MQNPWLVRVFVLVIAALAGASCSSSGTSGRSTSSSATTAPSSVPARPAEASLTVAGDPGLAGALEGAEVTCHYPDVAGLRISIFKPGGDATISYRIGIGPDNVFVHVDSGAGAAFRERNFAGTGVHDFDPATGARLDAALTDAPPTPGISPGAIGRITALRGSVQCGDQTPGSSTITVTGDTASGHYAAARLDPVIVECYFASDQVTVIGVARAGDTKVVLMVGLSRLDGVSVEEATTPPRYYSSPSGTSTLLPDGGRADGTVVERNAPRPHTLRVEGAATCGTPIRS